jgi:hypothetical protein
LAGFFFDRTRVITKIMEKETAPATAVFASVGKMCNARDAVIILARAMPQLSHAIFDVSAAAIFGQNHTWPLARKALR